MAVLHGQQQTLLNPSSFELNEPQPHGRRIGGCSCAGQHGYNRHMLLEPIGYIPPAEAEANYYRELADQAAIVA